MTDGQMRKRRKKENERTEVKKKKKSQSVLEYQTFADDFVTCQSDRNRSRAPKKLDKTEMR